MFITHALINISRTFASFLNFPLWLFPSQAPQTNRQCSNFFHHRIALPVL